MNRQRVDEAMNETVDLLVDSVRRQREEQRRYYGREPKSAKQVVARVMQQKAYAELEVRDELENAWRAVVGQDLFQQTRLGRIRRGVLDVVVGNSVVLQELTFRKHLIVDQLRKSFGGKAIRDIRFSSGSTT